jgi:DNA-binding NarL/FixJ family response regulator
MQVHSVSRPTLSVLVADDHTLFREGLVRLFQQVEGMIISGVDFQEVAAAAHEHKPDLAILCLGPNSERRWPVVETICRQDPTTCLLILDDAVRTANVRKALALQIRGYWTKHAAFAHISQAAWCLAAGRRAFCPDVDPHLYRTRHGLRYHPAHTGNPLQMLSRRETETLVLLARGLTMRECAQRMGISINTVDNHKTRLMRKLGVHKTVDLARLAVREGLLDDEG